jgi:muramoyltetrapeptide carboxypeptidase LdcA involved in peptidoglycan recycling
MSLRFPRPLKPGDRVAVTSPSDGVTAAHRGRLDVAVRDLEARGYEVIVGACMEGAAHVSAPVAERAAELTDMLTDPAVRAVVPPWGGELAIELLAHLDWERLAQAEPTWLVGWSDLSTVMAPLTLLTGTATLHGNNLMDTPYRTPEGLVSWLDIVEAPAGHRFDQVPPGRYRSTGYDDYAALPEVRDLTLDAPGTWTRLDGDGELDVQGRLIGGCVEALVNIAGSRYLDTSAFARTSAPEGLLVYVEVAGSDAFTVARSLHGMRLAGFFDAANAVLVGRTLAPDGRSYTQHQAVLDALGPLGVPIVADVECGHVAPYMPLVNGALARLVHSPQGGSRITQTLA